MVEIRGDDRIDNTDKVVVNLLLAGFTHFRFVYKKLSDLTRILNNLVLFTSFSNNISREFRTFEVFFCLPCILSKLHCVSDLCVNFIYKNG